MSDPVQPNHQDADVAPGVSSGEASQVNTTSIGGPRVTSGATQSPSETDKSQIIHRTVTDLVVHECCELFRAVTECSDEFLTDVAERGVQEPLAVLPDGKTVVDGQDRLFAARNANLATVPTRVVDPADVIEYIVKGKLNRQHLSEDQRGVLARRWQERRSEQLKHDRAVRGVAARRGEDLSDTAPDKKRDSRAESCSIFGVSERTARRMKEIAEKRPEALQEILRSKATSIDVVRDIHREEDRSRADAAAAITVQPSDIVDGEMENYIHCGDAVDILKRIKDETVSLVVTSPPYPGVAIDYGRTLAWDNYAKYLMYMEQVLAESMRILRPGGRVAWNIDTVRNHEGGRHYMHPLVGDIGTLAEKVGLNFWNDIAWVKDEVSGDKTSFGSFSLCSFPILNRNHEAVLIFYKGDSPKLAGDKTLCDLRREEYMPWWTSAWHIRPEVRPAIRRHPAPFPDELAARLIKLFTYRRDLVIDAFNGSGTTSFCAQRLGRRYIGIDFNDEYCRFARSRIADPAAEVNWQSDRVDEQINDAVSGSLGLSEGTVAEDEDDGMDGQGVAA